MVSSVPISVLKAEAKRLTRALGIPLAAALDRVARREGYSSWSLLRRRMAQSSAPFEQLGVGELVVVASARGEGKTIFAVQLMLAAVRRRRRSWFFSVDPHAGAREDLLARAGATHRDPIAFAHFDTSERLDGDHVIRTAAGRVGRGSVIVVDYLQVLDQHRTAPPLSAQVAALRRFARSSGSLILFISQVKSTFEVSARRMPTQRDLRLRHAHDARWFDKALFLQRGQTHLRTLRS